MDTNKDPTLADAGLTEDDIVVAPWNPFDYLKTTEEINEYLADLLMDDDPRLFLTALGHLARKKGMSL